MSAFPRLSFHLTACLPSGLPACFHADTLPSLLTDTLTTASVTMALTTATSIIMTKNKTITMTMGVAKAKALWKWLQTNLCH